MRTINLFVVHCSATREDCTLSPEALDVMHRCRGFNGTGYHYYIRKDGTLYLTRSLERIGAHAKGFNAHSIGICYEGGLDCRGHPDSGAASYAPATCGRFGAAFPWLPGMRASRSFTGLERER